MFRTEFHLSCLCILTFVREDTPATAEAIDETALPTYDPTSADKGSFGEDGDEPTPDELATLRHVGDKIPLSAWLVAVVELAERFTYYGLTGPFQNYMQNKRDDPRLPGALGLGQSSATGLQAFFQFCM